MHNIKKGFTLLELLVVVALIGLASTVVVAALSSSRNKGGDAALRSNLNSIRGQAEVYYLNHNRRYGFNTSDVSTCTVTDTFIASTTGQGAGSKIMDDLIRNARGVSNVRCAVASNGVRWAVSTSLNDGGYACVHSADQSIIASTTGLLVNSIVNNACVR